MNWGEIEDWSITSIFRELPYKSRAKNPRKKERMLQIFVPAEYTYNLNTPHTNLISTWLMQKTYKQKYMHTLNILAIQKAEYFGCIQCASGEMQTFKITDKYNINKLRHKLNTRMHLFS